jgi:hypothetical protein
LTSRFGRRPTLLSFGVRRLYRSLYFGIIDFMTSLPSKTRRELIGVLIGATLGAGLGFALTFFGHPFSEFFALAMAVFGGILMGGYFRGELGWMAYGTMFGAVLADFLWSNPKFNHAGMGIIPGALLGLIAGVIRDLVHPDASRSPPPLMQQDAKPRHK